MNEHLPDCWKRPIPDRQRTLFLEPLEEVFNSLHVTKEDLRGWCTRGWLSFDVDQVSEIDTPQREEVRFLRGLTRLGLSELALSRFLDDLPRPFSFDCDALAYHLDFGWVSVDRPDPFDVVEESIDDWLRELKDSANAARLAAIARTAVDLLAELADTATNDE